jgi:hypothetical protein
MTHVSTLDRKGSPSTPALTALAADAPYREQAAELALFGRFVGAWEFDATLFDAEGGRSEHTGEWHFGWVLEGRAIQDVLIVPPRAGRTDGEASRSFGTSLRFFDSSIGAWRVVWADPVNNVLVTLVAREEGEEIVIEGTTEAGRSLRWVWSEIAERSAIWRGYSSEDDGATWRLGEEMRLRRA